MEEELGVKVSVGLPVKNYLYSLTTKNTDEQYGVLVVCYSSDFIERVGDVEHEGEAGKAEFQQFALDEVESLSMPAFYKEAIKSSAKLKGI
jgi:hypothetical protein